MNGWSPTLDSAERLGKSAIKDRDLLSILVRANIATDLPHSQRLTDDEVLARKRWCSFLSKTRALIPSNRNTYLHFCRT
jgi:hypothetical protein